VTYRIALSIAALACLTARPMDVATAQSDRPAGASDNAGVPLQTNIPYDEARPILEALREDLLPAELRGRTSTERASAWPRWVSRRDADIRARLEQGDEDSIVNFTLLGTTFTTRQRVTERDVADMKEDKATLASVEGRIDDMAARLAAPGDNERLRFAREVVERHGIDPATAAGKAAVRQWLGDGIARVAAEYRTQAKQLYDPAVTWVGQSTLFRARGLSSDTDLFAGFGIEQTLDALKSNGLLGGQRIRRVAIIGPGLDFIDKHDGYDFYPQQTIQPFAVIDSLIRLGLAAADVRVAPFDLSPRVNHHLDMAGARARAGESYVIQLPKDTALVQWTPFLTSYWQHFGDQIGEEVQALRSAGQGALQVRAVRVRPQVVLSMAPPRDVNIVLQRLDPMPPDDRFDLVIATNILLYYDVFEQSLALANVAKMLRPGGFFLTNTLVAALPATPLDLLGSTEVGYTDRGGDRILWFHRR
jgi:hypothetical protein